MEGWCYDCENVPLCRAPKVEWVVCDREWQRGRGWGRSKQVGSMEYLGCRHNQCATACGSEMSQLLGLVQAQEMLFFRLTLLRL